MSFFNSEILKKKIICQTLFFSSFAHHGPKLPSSFFFVSLRLGDLTNRSKNDKFGFVEVSGGFLGEPGANLGPTEAILKRLRGFLEAYGGNLEASGGNLEPYRGQTQATNPRSLSILGGWP